MNDTQLIGTIFAALLGLAFGSFLNVCLSRLPEGESVVAPRSHCRECEHSLAWWENLPVLSWILLRGRCRQCRGWIGLRYPLVELAVGLLWTACWVKFSSPLFPSEAVAGNTPSLLLHSVIQISGYALFCWLLVALAALDVEYFWLPDLLTFPGIGAGFAFSLLRNWSDFASANRANPIEIWKAFFAILVSAGVVLVIRLAYWLVRRQEGMGLGDAKLMAMLGAWLGLTGALQSFALAILFATAAALLWLAILALRRKAGDWAQMPLPFGAFLCIAAIFTVFYPDWPRVMSR